MNREFEDANNDRVKLTEEIDKLKRSMQKIKSERDSSQRNYTKEVNVFLAEISWFIQTNEVYCLDCRFSHLTKLFLVILYNLIYSDITANKFVHIKKKKYIYIYPTFR